MNVAQRIVDDVMLSAPEEYRSKFCSPAGFRAMDERLGVNLGLNAYSLLIESLGDCILEELGAK